MQNLTDHPRIGESKRGNLEAQLGRMNKAIQERTPETEPKKEQSMEAGGSKVEKVSDAGNLGDVREGRENTENYRMRS